MDKTKIIEQLERWLDEAKDITGLPARWKRLADITSAESGEVYKMCAIELEVAWHAHAHDGAWDLNCIFCKVEKARYERSD